MSRTPVLGPWLTEQTIARKIEDKLVAATGQAGEELRENHGLLELLRWALHLQDRDQLLRCFEALANADEYADNLTYRPVFWILRWALDRPNFEVAGRRRRAATREIERRLWVLVEWPFVRRLPPDEALAWCREVAPLAPRWHDVRQVLVDQLVGIDDSAALELLLGEGGVANLRDSETQEKILARSIRRRELDLLEKRYPSFIGGLSRTHRGTFLSQAGRTEELSEWGHGLFAEISKTGSGGASGFDVVFDRNRRALHRWAHLEPEAFLAAAGDLLATPEVLRSSGGALLEAIVIVWQDLEPLGSLAARKRRDAKSWLSFSWNQDGVPVHIHALWNPEFSGRPEHRLLRLRWLRSAPSDKDIAQHVFAARIHDMLPEVESIADELLALDRQLERVLAVSTLAWHPEGDRWLRPLLDSDPSAWVRRHAEWALAVCRRDRLGRRLYRQALSADSWLDQQASFEQLLPLVLPTFSLWPTLDR